MRRALPILTAFAALALPAAALAHTGHAQDAGFAHGFAHPLGGVDHVLAMVAVGLWAAQMGGRALWALPAAFVGSMLVAGVLGLMGVAVPLVEPGIVGSVVALGALIAFRPALPLAACAALTAAFAVFHGYAHGAEMPEAADPAMYGLGFALATALLHGAGIAAIALVQRTAQAAVGRIATQGAGALVGFGGVALILLG